jgi:hypothetical protein
VNVPEEPHAWIGCRDVKFVGAVLLWGVHQPPQSAADGGSGGKTNGGEE